MTYRIFLDDERDPPDDGGEWVVCRTVGDAQSSVVFGGFPHFVSFDNDLGDGQMEGREFAKWLVERDCTFGGMAGDFAWYAHTQNPVARDAINGLLTAYVGHKANRAATGAD